MTEPRCKHGMLILKGLHTCSLCLGLGLDDRAELAVAGFTRADFQRPTVGRHAYADDVDDLADIHHLAHRGIDDLDDLDDAA